MNPSRALLRLLALLSISFGLIGMSAQALLLLAVFMASWALLLQRHNLPVLLQRIWRMRWFFLAIAILYGLATPTQESAHAWLQAAYHVGVLIVLVTAVGLCLNDLPASELAAGIVSLLRPLAAVGVAVDVFARRLAMCLQSVQLMDEHLRSMPRKDHKQALDSVAQLCWSAENWQPQYDPAVHPKAASALDLVLLLLLLSVLLLLRWMF